jgi:N utilization substance protein A
MKGARIHGIVRELGNENIDVINYTSNLTLFISRALAPAKISSIRMEEDAKRADIFLQPEEVSLAIGKNGSNIRLASQLTGYDLEVFRELSDQDSDDIYLDEFKDEIDEWVIDTLKEAGCATAKQVLAIPREELLERTDLEEETIDNVIETLKTEFEE